MTLGNDYMLYNCAICTFFNQIRLIMTPVGLWYLDLGLQEVAQLTGPIKLRPLCWRTKRLCSLTLWLQSKVWPGVNFRRQVLPLQHLELFLQLSEALQHLIVAAVKFLEVANSSSIHLFLLRRFTRGFLFIPLEWQPGMTMMPAPMLPLTPALMVTAAVTNQGSRLSLPKSGTWILMVGEKRSVTFSFFSFSTVGV